MTIKIANFGKSMKGYSMLKGIIANQAADQEEAIMIKEERINELKAEIAKEEAEYEVKEEVITEEETEMNLNIEGIVKNMQEQGILEEDIKVSEKVAFKAFNILKGCKVTLAQVAMVLNEKDEEKAYSSIKSNLLCFMHTEKDEAKRQEIAAVLKDMDALEGNKKGLVLAFFSGHLYIARDLLEGLVNFSADFVTIWTTCAGRCLVHVAREVKEASCATGRSFMRNFFARR